MNLKQINDIRARAGLPALVQSAEQIKAKRASKAAQNANRAAHAQLQRDIRALRNKNVKGR